MALQAPLTSRRLPFCSDSHPSPSYLLNSKQFINCSQQFMIKTGLAQKSAIFLLHKLPKKTLVRASNLLLSHAVAKEQTFVVMSEGRLSGQTPGLMEKPDLDIVDTDAEAYSEEGGEMSKLRARIRRRGGSRYKVLLLNHQRHEESHVVAVLPNVVPTVTEEQARQAFQDSRELGAGLVTVAVKEHAEYYALRMVRKGLKSTIEPEETPL